METDEYEISISRELEVCRSHIKELERSLCRMEKAYGKKTEPATADFGGGMEEVDPGEELAARSAIHQSLERWRTRKDEYEALLRAANTW